MTIQITDNQIALLTAFSKNDHVSDYGWNDEDATAWTDCLCDDMLSEGIAKGSLGGVLAKAECAGLIVNYLLEDGNITVLTDAGREALAQILA